MSKMASRIAGASPSASSFALCAALAIAVGCGSNKSDVDSAQAAYEKSENCKHGHLNENGAHDGEHWCDEDDGEGQHDAGPPDVPPPPPEPQCDAAVPPGDTDAGTGTDGGACGFAEYNDGLVGGQIADVAYDARSAGVVWAAAGSQLFKSTDSGATWTMVWEGSFGLRKLALPPGDPKVLIAATSSGIAKSTDGGVTWSQIALDGISISTLLVHPAQPLRVYAAVRGVGVIRSNDGGLTWGGADFGVPFGEFNGMATDPTNPDVILVGMVEVSAAGAHLRSVVLRSTDAGVSWTFAHEIPGKYFYGMAQCASNPDIVYAAMGKLAKSTDRGATWTTLDFPGHDVAIAASNCDRVYALQDGYGLRRSDDGATTFSAPLTTGIPFFNKFPRHVDVDPSQPDRFVGASHGGVLFSNNAGASFSLVGGVMNMAIRSLSSSPQAPDELWLAAWGSGVWKRSSGATPWTKSALDTVDYAFNVTADPVVESRTFTGTWSVPYRTTNGTSFTQVGASSNPFGFAVDPSNSNVVYMATQVSGLHKSTDGGASFTPSNGSLTPWDTGAGTFIDFRSVLVDRTNTNRIFVGSNTRGLFRSENGGATLSPIALPTKLVPCLAQGSDGAIYACVAGGGIVKSTDGGASFADASAGLTSLNVQALVADANGDLYATTNLGVFKSTNGAGAWSSFGNCLPPGGAGSAAIIGTGANKKLVVATSRGVLAHAL